MNKKIILWAIISALAGFLFGFDTVVISGADKKLQLLWHTSDAFHGAVVMGMALWGTVLGAIFGGVPLNAIGRKKTLIAIGILFSLSALGTAFANDPYTFAFFRFLGGIAIGASTVAAPTYISEIAPAAKRGFLVALYQFNIVFGILIAFFSNYYFSDFGENAWRWMMGILFLPAIIYSILSFFIVESPRWLLSKSKIASAKKCFEIINPEDNFDQFVLDVKNAENVNASAETIFDKKYRTALLLAFFISFFNQFSGINAFLYYAPRIFELAGLGEKTALLSSIGIGFANLVFTICGVFLIDRLGRKSLLYIGSVGYIISLTMVALSFFLGWEGMAVPGFLFLFIASHAIGQGAVIWVFIAEIFPNHLRASGQAFGCSTHWVFAAIIPSLVPLIIANVGAATMFLVFAVMMVFQLIWVHFFMPETKGVSLEDLSKQLTH